MTHPYGIPLWHTLMAHPYGTPLSPILSIQIATPYGKPLWQTLMANQCHKAF